MTTPRVTAMPVRPPGRANRAVDAPGSESHIITTTRRYGNAMITLLMTPATTSHTSPADIAAPKTANLAVNPAVSGIPASASLTRLDAPARTGEERPRPAQ